MHFFTLICTIFVTLFCVLQTTSADPGIFEKLFGYQSQTGGYGGGGYGTYNGYGGNYYNGGYGGGYAQPRPRPRPAPSSRSDGARRYKEVCRTINADSYVNPQGVPFPAQPFCPF